MRAPEQIFNISIQNINSKNDGHSQNEAKHTIICCFKFTCSNHFMQKDSTDIIPPVKENPIIGNWNLVSMSDTLFFAEQIMAGKITTSVSTYGSKSFQDN